MHAGDSTRLEVGAAFANLERLVVEAGMTLAEIVRVDNYYGTRTTAPGHFAARDDYYPGDPTEKPASTAVLMSRLLPAGCRYAIEGLAIQASRRPLVAPGVKDSPARLPMGIEAGDFVFLSGRMATDYEDGLAAEARPWPWHWVGSPIRAQTEYVLGMQQDILAAGGLSLNDVVKTEVFLTDPFHITGLDEVWREYFPAQPPARTIFVVDGLGVEDGVVEINHIALRRSSSLERRTIATPGAPTPLFHEPQAVQAGPLLFLSTQLAHDADGIAPEARPGCEFPHIGSPGRLEATRIIDAVRAIFEAAGGSLADVAKVQTHLTDLGQFDAVNEVWKRAFPEDPPAWTVVGMRGPLPLEGASMLCDVIGCLDTSQETW